MLLSESGSLGPMLRVAFMVFFAFWAVVLVVLYLGVGMLLKRNQRRGNGHGAGAAH